MCQQMYLRASIFVSPKGARDTAESGSLALGGQQKDALVHITGKNALAIVVGYAGTGKSTMLGVAREEWERAGYQVRGAALLRARFHMLAVSFTAILR